MGTTLPGRLVRRRGGRPAAQLAGGDPAAAAGAAAAQPVRSGGGWYGALARTGLVAKGVSYGLVGGLAVAVAAGRGGATTSREGALQAVAGPGWGKVLLVLLAAGFAAYAGWRLVQAVRGPREKGRGDGGAKAWAKRAGYLARAAIYLGLTASAARIAAGGGGAAEGGAGGGSQSQTQKAHHTTALVLDWPGGRWIVGAAGLAIAGAGAWNLFRGLTRRFEKRWRRGLAPAERRWGGRAGVAGHAARGVVFGLIGAFAVKAAVEFDPQEAIGLDGALRKLAHQAWGPWLLGLVATGLVLYGVYCLADARLRDVEAG